MKKIMRNLFAFLFLSFIASPAGVMAQTNSQIGTQADIDQFNQTMLQQLQIAQKRVEQAKAIATDSKRVPMAFDAVVLQNALIMFDVKRTLIGNLYNRPVLASPRARQAIMNVLQKDLITEGDLAVLQGVLNEENAALQAAQAPATVTPSTPVNPVTPITPAPITPAPTAP